MKRGKKKSSCQVYCANQLSRIKELESELEAKNEQILGLQKESVESFHLAYDGARKSMLRKISEFDETVNRSVRYDSNIKYTSQATTDFLLGNIYDIETKYNPGVLYVSKLKVGVSPDLHYDLVSLPDRALSPTLEINDLEFFNHALSFLFYRDDQSDGVRFRGIFSDPNYELGYDFENHGQSINEKKQILLQQYKYIERYFLSFEYESGIPVNTCYLFNPDSNRIQTPKAKGGLCFTQALVHYVVLQSLTFEARPLGVNYREKIFFVSKYSTPQEKIDTFFTYISMLNEDEIDDLVKSAFIIVTSNRDMMLRSRVDDNGNEITWAQDLMTGGLSSDFILDLHVDPFGKAFYQKKRRSRITSKKGRKSVRRARRKSVRRSRRKSRRSRRSNKSQRKNRSNTRGSGYRVRIRHERRCHG